MSEPVISLASAKPNTDLSVQFPSIPSLDVDEEAWLSEINRRVAEIRAGTAIGRPAEEVLAELRARNR